MHVIGYASEKKANVIHSEKYWQVISPRFGGNQARFNLAFQPLQYKRNNNNY